MGENAAPVAPRRRLIHRVPTPLRQHWKLAAAFVAFVAVLAGVFGQTRVRPYITGDATVIASQVTENITGSVDFFDTSVEHTFSVEFSESDYDKMIDAYATDGEKEWIEADITIDGTLVTDVGLRLKGNSTLRGLSSTESGGRGMQIPDGAVVADATVPAAAPEWGGGGGGMVSLSADDPASLPFLISFDKNVSGRAYQGMTQLSIRPGSPVLNEAMALSLTAESGQPTQRYSYAVYSVNGSETQTRLILEHPDEGYANSLFDSDGVLYKADANSSFTYQGDDQTTYVDQFKQINAEGSQDLQPIISFLKWLDSATDEQFDSELANWVDVDSFARYVATQNLLVNGDDMAGPGKNYYLWYDLESKKISVVAWDLNMALSGNSEAGPHDSISMGGGGMRGGAQQGVATDGAAPQGAMTEGAMPPGRAARGAGQMDAGQMGTGESAAGQEGAEQAPGGAMGGGMGGGMGGNQLKERFLASTAFTETYDTAYRELYEQLFSSGRALGILDDVASSIPLSDGLTEEALAAEVETMRTRLQARTDALADDPVIAG
ncbi:CotH kinase family protein [Rhodococcus globerulus]|uniref:CotH kinase family protein n=1 Tax=Rhodococcus TaxID=1827 RepID=UPI0012153FD5|nr:MAG: spore coat protein CotH [Rhodococcus sp. (in: high G+C Gram-positive bacteria)]